MHYRNQQRLFGTIALMADAAAYDPQALLTKPLDEIKAPVPYPVGEYVGTYVSREFDKAKTEKQQTIVRFMVRFDEPLPSVNEEEWARAINVTEGGKLPQDNLQKYEFWITPDALYRLKEAGEHAGIAEGEAANTAELIETMIGRQAVFSMTASKPNAQGKVYHNISGDAALPSAD